MGECLTAHAPLVWSMARRMLRDPSLAEDAVQDIFIQVWESAARYDPGRASERVWIATIARRRLFDLLRRQGAAPKLELLESDSVGIADERAHFLALDEEAELARRALVKLKPEQQRLISLSIMDGLSHSQIASVTGLPLGTVKTHLRAGLLHLRELLGSRVLPRGKEASS